MGANPEMTEDSAGGLNRRTVLKGAGITGAAAAAGGVGLIAMSGGAAALDNRGFTIENAEPVQTDDGSYDYVSMALASCWEWEGFDDPATDVTFTSEIRLPDYGESQVLYDEEIALEDLQAGNRGGSLDWSTGNGVNGVIHTGVGDASPILDDRSSDFHRDHDTDGSELSPQREDERWPVLVSPDYYEEEGDTLYSVPDPLVTDSPEPTGDGEEKETTVAFDKTVTVSNDSEEVSDTLSTTFTITIQNLEAGLTGSGEGDAETHTDDEKTP